MSDDYHAEIRFHGITSSPACVREPEGNGMAERLIRTLTEQVLWVERFATVAELLEALHAFQDRYNRTWLVQKHRHLTPTAAELR